MSVWRSEFRVALNDAISALEEASNQYQTASDRISNAEAEATLASLASRRIDRASTLRGMVHQEAQTPTLVPGEQLLLQTVATHLKALWAEDVSKVLLRALAASDQAVLDALARARAQAEDSSIAEYICEIEAEIKSERDDLMSIQD